MRFGGFAEPRRPGPRRPCSGAHAAPLLHDAGARASRTPPRCSRSRSCSGCPCATAAPSSRSGRAAVLGAGRRPGRARARAGRAVPGRARPASSRCDALRVQRARSGGADAAGDAGRRGGARASSPQLLAYRALNGAFGPSQPRGAQDELRRPALAVDVLFDPAHGLFVWSAAPAPRGRRPRLRRRARAPRRRRAPRCSLVALLLQVWINGSVESWTQAGAFGSRRFVGGDARLGLGPGRAAGRGPASRSAGAPSAVGAVVALRVVERLADGAVRPASSWTASGLEWPRVAMSQVTEVPRRLGPSAWLFFTDRERLVREGPMISQALLERVACPVCLEADGLRARARDAAATPRPAPTTPRARPAPAAGPTRCGSRRDGEAPALPVLRRALSRERGGGLRGPRAPHQRWARSRSTPTTSSTSACT